VKRKIWNTESLKSENNIKKYQEALDTTLSNQGDIHITIKDLIEERWVLLKSITVNASQETVGVTKYIRNEEWSDQECIEILNKKNQARLKMLQQETRQNCEVYRNIRKEAKAVCHTKKKGKY